MSVRLRLAFSDGKRLPFDQSPKGIDELRRASPSHFAAFLEVNNLLTYNACSQAFDRALDMGDEDQAQDLLSRVQGQFCSNGEVISFVTPDNRMYVTKYSEEAERFLMMNSYQRGRINIPLGLDDVALTRITPENRDCHKDPDVNVILQGCEALKNFGRIRQHFMAPNAGHWPAVSEAVRGAMRWFP